MSYVTRGSFGKVREVDKLSSRDAENSTTIALKWSSYEARGHTYELSSDGQPIFDHENIHLIIVFRTLSTDLQFPTSKLSPRWQIIHQ